MIKKISNVQKKHLYHLVAYDNLTISVHDHLHNQCQMLGQFPSSGVIQTVLNYPKYFLRNMTFSLQSNVHLCIKIRDGP